MTQIFITNLTINKVRHLENISIPLAEEQMKHLILTGKNGSGKTSVVEAMAGHINSAFTDEYFQDKTEWLNYAKKAKDQAIETGEEDGELFRLEKNVCGREEDLNQSRRGVDIKFNNKAEYVYELKEKNHYILAYYSADRIFQAEQPLHVEKIQLRDDYGMTEFPRSEFVKYLLDLKMTEALARNGQKIGKADEIKLWFERLEKLLKTIFADEMLRLIFDEETFEFHIVQQGKEPFDFNTLSSGYQAVLDIVLDIMMRMQKQTGRSFHFNLPGIVLVDEIETHLHLELQKNGYISKHSIYSNISFTFYIE